MQWTRRRLAQASFAALAAGCSRSAATSQALIVHGGTIYTGVASTPTAEALRIEGNRIAAIGTLADVRTAGARVLDLHGGTALPGFVDSHVHLTEVGLQAMSLNLVGTASVVDLQQRLRAYAAQHATGPIQGGGWIETHWPEHRFPRAADLDAVVSDRPVVLWRADGHAVVANSAGLALGGIDARTPDPQGGRIERDGHGAVTGMLIDNAQGLVTSRLPAPTRAQVREALKQAAQLYASRGWVGVANMSTSAQDAELFAELGSSGEMPLFVDLFMTPEAADPVLAQGQIVHNARLVTRGVKLYMDGALGSRGAALLAPYSDAPGTGLLVTPIETMRAIMQRAKAVDAQVTTHAIGDRGNRMVLDAYRDTFGPAAEQLRGARWRIEHAQILSPQDIPRFGQMGVIASMQPSHCISDMYFAPARLGEARLAGAYAWKALLDSGAVICGGTDAPVEKGDPLIEYYAAVYRHSLDGFAAPDWHLENAVSRAQALAMFTTGAAYACRDEAARGTLAVGMRAHVSAFSVDLMTAEPAQIPTATPVLTISDGVVTHQAAA